MATCFLPCPDAFVSWSFRPSAAVQAKTMSSCIVTSSKQILNVHERVVGTSQNCADLRNEVWGSGPQAWHRLQTVYIVVTLFSWEGADSTRFTARFKMRIGNMINFHVAVFPPCAGTHFWCTTSQKRGRHTVARGGRAGAFSTFYPSTYF